MPRNREMDIDFSVHDFKFTRNWFRNRNLSTFREYIYPEWAGKPITYLEIGVFEGASMVWMLQKVLTHSDSKAVGIDPWLQMMPKWSEEAIDEIRFHAFHNIEPWRDRCTLVRACSAHYLAPRRYRDKTEGVRENTIDLCMVDGNHDSLPMLFDAKNCLRLVKPGGWLIFDDVDLKSGSVLDGLKMFLSEHGDKVKLLWKHNYVEAYQKL